MVFVLTQSHDGCSNSYSVEEFKTREDAIKHVINSSYYPTDYIFIEGNKLRFGLLEVTND